MQDAPMMTSGFTPATNLLNTSTSPMAGGTLPSAPIPHMDTSATSPSTTTFQSGSTSAKRKRSHFIVEPVLPNSDDVVTLGLISPEDAESYFTAFFQGCHQYVPVFDPRCDSMHAIRSRSGLLFSTICTVGCRVLKGTESHPWRLLNFHIKRVLNATIAGGKAPGKTNLETVQALLVRACFVSERSILVTVATRLAIDLRLFEAYDELSTRFITRASLGSSSGGNAIPENIQQQQQQQQEDDIYLMRKVRTWIHLLVLGYLLHVDAGDLLTFKFAGNVRRSRILLDTPNCTDMDLHLFSQLELNVIRANTYAALAGQPAAADDAEIMDVVQDAKIDIDVWFNDWTRIFERRAVPAQRHWLALHLRIQQCWADTMALCRAVRISGVENVDAMTAPQRSMLLMAKEALKQHLEIILEEPRSYLRNLRYAMDFVWAKCAFCFLLLLKLSMLVAEDDEQTSRLLLARGKTLLAELHATGGGRDNSGGGGGGRNSTSRVYLQLLQTGMEKFSRTALGENLTPSSSQHLSGTSTPRQPREGREGSGSGNNSGAGVEDEHNELESFVPEQFVFEWDFPGLTLFSNPTTEAGWLDDFLRGALVGGEDFYGFGWNPVDPG